MSSECLTWRSLLERIDWRLKSKSTALASGLTTQRCVQRVSVVVYKLFLKAVENLRLLQWGFNLQNMLEVWFQNDPVWQPFPGACRNVIPPMPNFHAIPTVTIDALLALWFIPCCFYFTFFVAGEAWRSWLLCNVLFKMHSLDTRITPFTYMK